MLAAALWILYAVMWVGGLVTYIGFGGVRAGDEWTAPLFLGLAGAIVLVSGGRPWVPALLAAAAAGFVCEWVGLVTGRVFGTYVYTDALFPKLAGVPVVIGCAWMVLAAAVHESLRPRRWSPAVGVAAGAALLMAIDLVLDPLAAGPLGYWRWPAGGPVHGVPLGNFAGWFGCGAVILALVWRLAPRDRPLGAATAVGWTIVLFFTILAAWFGFPVPAAAGTALCAATLASGSLRPGRRTSGG